jgi:hypothetical protein
MFYEGTMSSIKDYLSDMQEIAQDKQIAEILGISSEELNQLDWELHTDCSDDELIYGYRIEIYSHEPREIIDKIVDLDEFNQVHLPAWQFSDDEHDQELEWEIQYSEQFTTLQQQLNTAESILNSTLSEKQSFDVLVMLQIYIIAVIENYLSSTFIRQVINNDVFIRKIIETDPVFKKQTISLSEIYKESDKIKMTVAGHLKELLFQQLEKVKPMYKKVLNIEFGDVSWLFTAIALRHDCAHRAGYTKDGNKIQINKNKIKELIKNCRNLASLIDESL